MNDLIIAILGSGVLSTLISGLFTMWSKRQDAKNGQNEGMRLVLKDRLRSLCIGYIQQGWIYVDELEDVLSMHECYHNKLGGNGFLDELIKDVKALPVKGIK